MNPDDRHLSRIVTHWSIVYGLHGAEPQAVRSAQEALLERYGEAVHRYLLGALRDTEAAQELFQEFALRFVRGDLQRANPQQGRFRDYLKTVVYRLIMDHHRRRGRDARRVDLPVDAAVEAQQEWLPDIDAEFTRSWRDQLLSRTWHRLKEWEESSGKPYHSVLRARVNDAAADSQQLALQLSEQTGKSITSGNLRVLLHRARDRFAEMLLEEVTHSLHDPSRENLEQELIALDLHRYCRDRL